VIARKDASSVKKEREKEGGSKERGKKSEAFILA
jgi:hypothetical protein